MYATLLTITQIRNYRYTGGYETGLKITPAVTPPLDNETWMCDTQMVRRNDYLSFSVLGLSLIVGPGTLIILINLTLSTIVRWYQKRYQRRVHASLEWEMLETETLQRQAYKMQGVDLLEHSTSIAPLLDGKGTGGVLDDASTPEKVVSPRIEQREIADTSQERISNSHARHSSGSEALEERRV